MPYSAEYAYNWAHRCDLQIGTRIMVMPSPNRGWGRMYPAQIVGYDLQRTKYLAARISWSGNVSPRGDYIFPTEVLEHIWDVLVRAGERKP